jgi:hypothetical protein
VLGKKNLLFNAIKKYLKDNTWEWNARKVNSTIKKVTKLKTGDKLECENTYSRTWTRDSNLIDSFLEAMKNTRTNENKEIIVRSTDFKDTCNIIDGKPIINDGVYTFKKRSDSGKRARCKVALDGKWMLTEITWDRDDGKWQDIEWACSGTNNCNYTFRIYSNDEGGKPEDCYNANGKPVVNAMRFYRKEFFARLKACTHQELHTILAEAILDNNILLREVLNG